MRITRRDFFAPANAITLTGLILTVYGTLRLNTWGGFISSAIGRILDMLDGPIARHTHSSRFGAVLDATVDKITVVCITLGLLAFNLSPKFVVLYILFQNGITSALNMIAANRKIIVATTKAGKINIFLQMTSMLLFVLASLLPWLPGFIVNSLAFICLGASLPYAFQSIRDYSSLHR